MADGPDNYKVAQGIGTVGADGEVTGRGWRSLWCILIVQAQNAFNDKVAQYVLLTVAIAANFGDTYKSIVAFLLTIPFILFAPLAGWLADRFSKRLVMMWCLYAQLAILFFISISLYFGSIWTATAGFFVLAVQSAFFSPAKTGILKEIVGTRKLAVAAGWGQMLVMIGIIAGTAVGGLAIGWMLDNFEVGSRAAAFYSINVIGVLSIGAIIAGLSITKTPSGTSDPLHKGILIEHFSHLKELLKERSLRLTAMGISYFWLAGVLVSMIVIEVAEAVTTNAEDAGARAGFLTAYMGIGIAVGSCVVSAISWRRNELGIIPIGGFGMAVVGILCGVTPMDSPVFSWLMVLIGFFAGFFFVPLNALLQELAPSDRRGRIISASGLLDSLAIILGIAIQLGMSLAGFHPQWQFIVMGTLTFFASIYVLRILPQNFLRFMVAFLLRVAYRVRGVGLDNVPRTGGALLVGNHLSYMDAFMIGAASPRPVRFVIFEDFYKIWWMRWFLKLCGAVPISKTRAKDAVREVARAVKAGDLVCIFPEGQLSRTGALGEFKKGFALMARQAKSPVIPVYMDGLWGSIFSFERDKFVFKWPHRLPYRLSVAFGPALPEGDFSADTAKAVVMGMSAEAVSQRREVQRSPRDFLLQSLKTAPWRTCLIDVSRKRRVMRRSSVWATSVVLGGLWEKEIEGEGARVAVLLPPGTSAALANLGLWMAGKVPVNMPFSMAEKPGEVARLYREGRISAVVSSSMIRDRVPDFPWPDTFIDMLDTMKRVSGTTIFWETIRALLEPKFWARRRLGLGRDAPGDEVPGSREAACSVVAAAPNPEGDGATEDGGGRPASYRLVPHSSGKLLANSACLGSVNGIIRKVKIVNGYTLDTTPGLIIGLVHALAEKTPVIHLPLTLNVEKLSDLLRREGALQIVAEPALFRGLTQVPYEVSGKQVRRLFTFARPGRAESAGAAGVGAETGEGGESEGESLDAEVARDLEERFGSRVHRGLVLSSAGAIVALNVPDPVAETSTARHQHGHREGSEGRLFPGIAVEMLNPGTGEAVPLVHPVPADLRLSGLAVEVNGEPEAALIRGCRLDVDGFLFLGKKGPNSPSSSVPDRPGEEG